jgi:hypothetical protein
MPEFIQQSGFHLQSSIQNGIWKNYSQSSILGLRITLRDSDALILATVIGLFLRLCAFHSFSITRFLLHRQRAKLLPQDGLFQQQQIVLRNIDSDYSAVFKLSRIWWEWKDRSSDAFSRSAKITGIALVHFLLLSTLAVFSSKIISTGDREVLVASQSCGELSDDDSVRSVDAFNTVELYRARQAKESASYARACYNKDKGQPECEIFVRKELPVAVKTVSCPFARGLCRAEALQVDTGRFNTLTHLGANTAKTNSLDYRKVTTCAPLRTDGYEEQHGSRSDYSELSTARLRLGKFDTTDFTYQFPIYNANSTEYDYPNMDSFTLRYRFYITGAGDNIWSPISDLLRGDGDILVIFLSAGNIKYSSPISDPWYKATQCNSSTIFPDNTSQPTCSSDYYISALGCIEQYQICGNEASKCTSLNASTAVQNETAGLKFNNKQRALIERLTNTPSSIVTALDMGDGALLANDALQDGTVRALAPNHWKSEVLFWHNTSMVTMQRRFAEYASGPSDTSIRHRQIKPNTTEQISLCHSQKVLSSRHRNFSLLGIALIAIIGTIDVLFWELTIFEELA